MTADPLPIMQGTPPPPEARVPFADWDRPPWNRWSFQHMRQLVPTAEVWRGDGPVSDLPQAHREIGEIAFETATGEPSTVAEMIATTYTNGFLVMKGGRIVHESYHGGMERRTLHLSQSVAKSVTALAAGVLMGRGLLDPQAPVTRYLPELAATAWDGALLTHVFDMTSGTRFDETYTDPASDIGQMDVASGWKPVPPGYDPSAWHSTIWDQMLGLTTLEAAHGERFQYRSIETDVIAHAMERVTGQRLPQIVSETVWQPIGAEESASFTVDRAGYGLSCGGFNATLRDYARVGRLVLERGRAGKTQVVPEAWIDDILSGPHGLFNDLARIALPNGQYRNQFWIEDRDRRTVMARGVFGQLIYIAPEQDAVVVKLSAWPEFLNPERDITTRRAIQAMLAELA